jgi:UrcA family protein
MFRSAVALAFLGSVAIAGIAQAQERNYRIPINDLDLSIEKDKARFDQRAEVAARQLCDDRRQGLGQGYRECLQAVRDEANEKLQIALWKNNTQMSTAQH